MALKANHVKYVEYRKIPGLKMLTHKEILKELNQRITELKEEFSVSRIGVFGSVVRNEAQLGSDIDILVDLADPTFDHYMDLKFYLEKLFKRSVDLVIADSVKPRIKPIIDQEVIYAQGL